MNCSSLLFVSFVLVLAAAAISGNDKADLNMIHEFPTNSKFLNPHLDEDTNMQGIIEDSEGESSTAAPLAATRGVVLVRTLQDTQDKPERKQSKLFSLGLLSLMRPVFGSGLGYGGAYGSQYYGLGGSNSNHQGGLPYYNFPYYNYFKTGQQSEHSRAQS